MSLFTFGTGQRITAGTGRGKWRAGPIPGRGGPRPPGAQRRPAARVQTPRIESIGAPRSSASRSPGSARQPVELRRNPGELAGVHRPDGGQQAQRGGRRVVGGPVGDPEPDPRSRVSAYFPSPGRRGVKLVAAQARRPGCGPSRASTAAGSSQGAPTCSKAASRSPARPTGWCPRTGRCPDSGRGSRGRAGSGSAGRTAARSRRSTASAATRTRHDVRGRARGRRSRSRQPGQLAQRHAVPHRHRAGSRRTSGQALSSTLPCTAPPIGFGRSSTTTGMPARAGDRITSIVVEM